MEMAKGAMALDANVSISQQITSYKETIFFVRYDLIIIVFVVTNILSRRIILNLLNFPTSLSGCHRAFIQWQLIVSIEVIHLRLAGFLDPATSKLM